MKKKRLLFGIGLFAIACSIWLIYPRRYHVSQEKYQQILDEVMSVDFPFRYLTPDNSGMEMAYVHEAEQGRGLFLMDLKTLKRTQLPITNEVIQVNGWSPDDRYLAFVETPPNLPDIKVQRGSALAKEEWITLYDGETKAIRRLTKVKNVIESRFLWLGTNSYLYVARKLKGAAAEAFVGSFDSKPIKLANYLPILDSPILVKDNIAAYTERGEILTLNLTSPTNSADYLKPRAAKVGGGGTNSLLALGGDQITEFKKSKGFKSLRWLRYDRVNNEYLFCATPQKSDWRYLYSYNPQTKKLVQLSKNDTYNGQFLEGGKGFAYVGNTNFLFYLCVRPRNAINHTNFFMQGGLSSYAATPSGDKIYAVAAQGIEPAGIWEYDLSARKLQLAADGFNKPFHVSRVIEPQEFKIKSFDDLEIPSFLYPPLDLISNANQSALSPRTKYPVVVYCPPISAGVKRVFNARMQLLSNLGFYVLAMNYRGCEGYGAKYAELNDTTSAAKDILAGYEFILKNPNVDKKRIFLCSDSAGSAVVDELLATSPQLWRAVSVENPEGLNWSRFDPTELPPMFYAIGDQDGSFNSMKHFDEWAKTNNVSVTSVIYTNSGHITYKTSQRKDKLDRVAKFFISHL